MATTSLSVGATTLVFLGIPSPDIVARGVGIAVDRSISDNFSAGLVFDRTRAEIGPNSYQFNYMGFSFDRNVLGMGAIGLSAGWTNILRNGTLERRLPTAVLYAEVPIVHYKRSWLGIRLAFIRADVNIPGLQVLTFPGISLIGTGSI